jgi:hypothetical protein
MSLTLALIALAIGPIAWQFLDRVPSIHRALGVIMAVVMAGLVVMILIHTVEEGGAISIAFAAGGFVLPLAAERALRRSAWTIHRLTLALGIIGLLVHSLSDGAALTAAQGMHGHGATLVSAIILHRLPMGLGIWWLVSSDFGNKLAVGALLVMALATVVGYLMGGALLSHLEAAGQAWFIAFVAGSLAHLAVHRLGGSYEGHTH